MESQEDIDNGKLILNSLSKQLDRIESMLKELTWARKRLSMVETGKYIIYMQFGEVLGTGINLNSWWACWWYCFRANKGVRDKRMSPKVHFSIRSYYPHP